VVNGDPRPDLIFYATTLVLYILIQIYFMRTLKTSYYQKYVSHRKRIITQAMGMQLFLAVKVMLDIWQLTDFAGVQQSEDADFFIGSAIYYLQTILAFVVVLVKQPEDCFACFNRLGPKRTYSIYQYPIERNFDDTLSRITAEVEGNRVSFGSGRKLSVIEVNELKKSIDKEMINKLLLSTAEESPDLGSEE
jgi:hypothetical protein